VAGATRIAAPRTVGVSRLVFMTYAVVCSGAYGLEEMVSGAGPGLAVAILAVVPVVYSLPVALACAELTARFPVEGGYYRWARIAFGDGVGYVCGWLVWVATFATSASVAVLFSSYLRYFAPDLSGISQAAVSALVIWLVVFMNWRGIRVVGAWSVLFTALVVVPFVATTAIAIARWQHNPLIPFANPDPPLPTAILSGMLIAIWLYGGFEKLTLNAEEVSTPQRTFPIALMLSVPLCALTYLVPTAAALAATGDWRDWHEAHFVAAATALGGRWLGAAMAAGALVSNFSILMVTTLAHSRLPVALAEDGLFPRAFVARHRRFGTPVTSLLVTGVILTALCALPFAQLAAVAALVQAASYLLIYAALIKLRRTPAAAAAFQIPLGTAGLLALFAPTLLIVAIAASAGLWSNGHLDVRQTLMALAVLLSGPIGYAWLRWRRVVVRVTPTLPPAPFSFPDPGGPR
jgi:amino acid transporter